MPDAENGVIKEHTAAYVAGALFLSICAQAGLAGVSMFHSAQQWDVVVNTQAALKDMSLLLAGALAAMLKGS